MSNVARGEATLRGYVSGFAASVALTLAAYFMASHHAFNGQALVAALGFLAFTQFAVQLFFFLHLGSKASARARLLVFGLMLMVAMILVGGSLWIMKNLNYNMTSQQVNNYLQSQDGL